jgi:transcription antitermination factor NusG
VFVRYLPQARISVISTPGVIRLLDVHDCDAVCTREIDRIRESMAGGYVLRPHPYVSVGTRVRVRNGVFDGVEGMVTEFRHQCKVVIALSAVQQCFSLEVDLGDLEVLQKPVSRFVADGMGNSLRACRA